MVVNDRASDKVSDEVMDVSAPSEGRKKEVEEEVCQAHFSTSARETLYARASQ